MTVLVFAACPAHADLLGDTIKPFISFSEMYDSNIFRVKNSAQLKAALGDSRMADFVSTLSVGTELHYGISRETLDVHLEKDFLFYSHYTSQNMDQDNVNGTLGITLLDKVHLKLNGYYQSYPEARVDYRSTAVNEVSSTGYGASLSYETARGIGLTAGYHNSGISYSLFQYRPNEYNVDSYSGSAWYRLAADARAYVTYQRDNTNYPNDMYLGGVLVNNSSVADSVRIGLEKTVSSKTAVSCYVGFLSRRHEFAQGRDFSGVIANANVTYGVTGKLGLLLNFQRQIYEETYTDYTYSITDSLGLGLVYELAAKVKATLYEKLSWKDFQEIPFSGVPQRNDFLQQLNLGVEWNPVNRVFLDLGYQYSTRSSNDPTLGFTDHAVMTSVAYKF